MKTTILVTLAVLTAGWWPAGQLLAMGNQPQAEVQPSAVSELVIQSDQAPAGDAIAIDQKTIKLTEAQPCSITVQIPVAGPTTLSILDEQDKVMAVLVDRILPAGPHAFFWDTTNVQPGTYTILLKTSEEEKKDTIQIVE